MRTDSTQKTRRAFRRTTSGIRSAPDHTVPYGTVLLGWECSRHFVPGYDRTVPPGLSLFLQALNLPNLSYLHAIQPRVYPTMLSWPLRAKDWKRPNFIGPCDAKHRRALRTFEDLRGLLCNPLSLSDRSQDTQRILLYLFATKRNLHVFCYRCSNLVFPFRRSEELSFDSQKQSSS
jgi:hypothetical protein